MKTQYIFFGELMEAGEVKKMLEDLRSNADKQKEIAAGGIDFMEKLKKELRAIRNGEPELEKTVEWFRKWLSRAIAEQREKRKTGLEPAVISRTVSIDRENDAVAKIEDFDKLTAVLRSPAGRAVIDAINKYTMEIWNGRGECTELDTSEGGRYVIKTDWNVFCRHGEIKGDLRKAVKNLLFPGVGKRGELEKITVVQGSDKKGNRYIVEADFIHVVMTQAKETERRLKSGGLLVKKETRAIGMFRLEISKPIWSHLSQKDIILAGQARGRLQGAGFYPVPLYQQDWTDKVMKQMQGFHEVNPGKWPRPTLKKNQYIALLSYIIHRYHTGKQRRVGSMVVKWGDLRRRDIVHTHKGRRTRRLRELAQCAAFLTLFANLTGNIFDAPQTVQIDDEGEAIIISPQQQELPLN